jgi:negative regulator of flagellin synthesis FlgM
MSIDRIAGQDAARSYIQNTDAARTANANAAQQARAYQQTARTSRADSVTLSDDARSLAAARDAVRSAPDVRHEKVAAIKQQVDSGTYQVAAHVLARNLLHQS